MRMVSQYSMEIQELEDSIKNKLKILCQDLHATPLQYTKQGAVQQLIRFRQPNYAPPASYGFFHSCLSPWPCGHFVGRDTLEDHADPNTDVRWRRYFQLRRLSIFFLWYEAQGDVFVTHE